MADGKYYAINAEDAKDAYELMTADRSSVRFAEKGTFDPNFEVKFARKETDFYSMNNDWVVDLGGRAVVRISPTELEIAYKLFLEAKRTLITQRMIKPPLFPGLGQPSPKVFY